MSEQKDRKKQRQLKKLKRKHEKIKDGEYSTDRDLSKGQHLIDHPFPSGEKHPRISSDIEENKADKLKCENSEDELIGMHDDGVSKFSDEDIDEQKNDNGFEENEEKEGRSMDTQRRKLTSEERHDLRREKVLKKVEEKKRRAQQEAEKELELIDDKIAREREREIEKKKAASEKRKEAKKINDGIKDAKLKKLTDAFGNDIVWKNRTLPENYDEILKAALENNELKSELELTRSMISEKSSKIVKFCESVNIINDGYVHMEDGTTLALKDLKEFLLSLKM